VIEFVHYRLEDSELVVGVGGFGVEYENVAV
jgi:hypothetical protein